jgi:hypothetical protein
VEAAQGFLFLPGTDTLETLAVFPEAEQQQQTRYGLGPVWECAGCFRKKFWGVVWVCSPLLVLETQPRRCLYPGDCDSCDCGRSTL